MCFSPVISFTASAVLIPTGLACVHKLKNHSQALFALIPLIFGLQQFAEGVLWISLQNQEFIEWRRAATYIFVSTAQLVWPLLVPFSILAMEHDKNRRNILMVFAGIGLAMFAYLLNNILFHPVYAQIVKHHIVYEFDFPHNHKWLISGILYFIPTVGSHFISSNYRINQVGKVVFLSLLITYLFYAKFAFSVWCFFTAIISVLVYRIIAIAPVHDYHRQHAHHWKHSV